VGKLEEQIARLDIEVSIKNYQGANEDYLRNNLRDFFYLIMSFRDESVLGALNEDDKQVLMDLQRKVEKVLSFGKAVVAVDKKQEIPYMGEFNGENGPFIFMSSAPLWARFDHKSKKVDPIVRMYFMVQGLAEKVHLFTEK